MKFPSKRSVLICTALFFLLLIVRFPYENLRGYIFAKIYKASGIYVTAQSLAPVFLGWPGARLKQVEIVAPPFLLGASLAAERLTVRASLGGIFPPIPKLSLYFQNLKEGGDLYVRGGQTRSLTEASFQTAKLTLDQFVVPFISGNISGTLNSQGQFSIPHDDLSKATGAINLNASGLILPGQTPMPGITIASVKLNSLKGLIQITNSNLEIKTFQFGDDLSDARGNLSGDLKLAKTLAASTLNLVLKIQLSDQFIHNPQAATTVSFLQSFRTSTPNEYAMKWAASIGEMHSNLYAALPQAVQ